MNVLHIFPKNKNTCLKKIKDMVIKLETKCIKLVRKKLRFVPPVLLKLLSKVCVIVASVVCLKHTQSFLYYRLVQYTS